MDFFETVDKRRSIRAFENKEVDASVVKRLLETINLAPSAGNLQAYKVYVAKTQTVKEELAVASFDQGCMQGAPLVMVFSADQKRSEMKYEERGAELYAPQDATIAAAYCQLAATALGLGSVWVGAFDSLEVSRIIEAGEYEVPVAMLAIGYPAEKPERKGRRPLDEMVKEI